MTQVSWQASLAEYDRWIKRAVERAAQLRSFNAPKVIIKNHQRYMLELRQARAKKRGR